MVTHVDAMYPHAAGLGDGVERLNRLRHIRDVFEHGCRHGQVGDSTKLFACRLEASVIAFETEGLAVYASHESVAMKWPLQLGHQAAYRFNQSRMTRSVPMGRHSINSDAICTQARQNERR